MPLHLRRGRSLERRLPLILTAVLLATLGTALYFTHRALISGAEQAAHRGLASASQALVGSMETAARQREAQLRAAAGAPALRRLLLNGDVSPEATEAAGAVVRPLFIRTPNESEVVLFDAAGTIVARWGGRVVEALPPELRRVPPAPETHGANAPWSADLFLSSGRLHSWTALRLRDAMGRPIGTLASLRRTDPRQDVTATLRNLTGEDVTLYVRNVDGGPWFRLDGRAVQPSIRGTLADSSRFAERPEVGTVLFAEQRVAGTPWAAVLESPARSVHAEPQRTTRRLALIVLVLALAGAIVTWRIVRGVTHPLHQLSAAADELAKGRPTPPVDLDRDDELGQLAHSFDEMSRQIAVSRTELERRIADVERANRAKADFLAMMSHELRTPLNAIAGYAQLLEMGIHGPLTSEQRDALQRIGHSQRHLLHLIEDVLSFARIDAGRVEFTLAEVPLDESIDVVLSMVAPQARAKRVTITATHPDKTLTVYADREKLDQILLNLVANAVKFTPADGRVDLGAEVLPEHDEHGRELVQIRVSDTGPGVAPDHQATIFEPFVQGDRALNRPGEGVGLGLAISRDLTEGMGGRIALDSSRHGGATFVVTLLRHAPDVIADEPASPLAATIESAPGARTA